MTLALLAVAVGSCAFAAAILVLRPRGSWVRERIEPYLAAAPPATAVDGPRAGRGGEPGRFDGAAFARPLRRELARAGSRRRPAELAWATVAAALLGTVAGALAGGPALAVFAALAGAAAPHALLRIQAAQRRRRFDADLPDILDTLASSLRVGHGFEHSLRAVAETVDEPAASELTHALGEIRLGRDHAEALADLGHRLSSADMPFVTTAVEIQQQVGGSLAELLAVVSETVRERQQFRRKLKALTGMGRMSAAVLVVLPIAVAGLLLVISPSYLQPLWSTSTGRTLVGAAVAMMILGAAILKKIVSVKG